MSNKGMSPAAAAHYARRAMGDEPVLKDNFSQVELIRAYSWYNYMMEPEKAREFVQKEFADKPDVLAVSSALKPSFFTTEGWNCRIMQQNPNLREKLYEPTYIRLINLRRRIPEVVIDVEEEPKVSALRAKREDRFIGDFEYQFDTIFDDPKAPVWNIYDWLQSNQVPQYIATAIENQVIAVASEYRAAYEKTDDQVVEAYSRFKKRELKRRLDYLDLLVEQINRYTNNRKKERKPRAKKVKSADQILAKVQYQEKSDEFKLQSISPALILGATQLWVFNTRYRKLGVYHALDGGFGIKGTTIQNFDEKKSIEKRIRKPEEALVKALGYTKPQLRKLLGEFKTAEIALTGRLGHDTVLLRVFK